MMRERSCEISAWNSNVSADIMAVMCGDVVKSLNLFKFCQSLWPGIVLELVRLKRNGKTLAAGL